jgi:hypothetical protein
MRIYRRTAIAVAILAILCVLLASCRRQTSSDNETPDTSTYHPLATPATEFEQKLKDMRDAHFQYTWVFTRLDGKEFTSEDSEILHKNAPSVVDWIGMNDKKKYIAGSNFPIEPKNLVVLEKHYKIEDVSEARP